MSVHLQRSIDIQAPLGFVFEQSNQLDQWPQMIPCLLYTSDAADEL